MKEPAKRGSSSKVNNSDHLIRSSNMPHKRALLIEQNFHVKSIRNLTEANCCLIRVNLFTGIRVQTGTIVIMPDQVLNASYHYQSSLNRNRGITSIETNGLVVTCPTADHRVGGSSPGLGITFSNVIVIGNGLKVISKSKAYSYKAEWLRGKMLDRHSESRGREAGSNPV